MPKPQAEIRIDKRLVRQLVDAQFPEAKHLELHYLDSGWDNELFRLGSNFLVRLPRREQAVDLIANELKWLPKIAQDLPIPTSAALHIGTPTTDYPWPWSIVPWFDGKSGLNSKLAKGEAKRLAIFLKALHQPAPIEAPSSKFRGIPIADRKKDTEPKLQKAQMEGLSIKSKHIQLWNAALEADTFKERFWMHGDLHPNNMVLEDGRIQAIIDWGDMNAGDPASDLVCLWMLFNDAGEHQSFLDTYNPHPSMLARSIGWALFYVAHLYDIDLYADLAIHTLENLEKFA